MSWDYGLTKSPSGKMETIRGEIHGQVFTKKTSKGKRFIAYAQDENGNISVCSFKTAAKASDWGFWMRDKYDYLAHGWVKAEVVQGEK